MNSHLLPLSGQFSDQFSEHASERFSEPPDPALRRVGQLGRAAAVMDVVADLGVASPAQIGRRLGLAKSTVHRLLTVLQVHDLVRRDRDGVRLGLRSLGWADRERAAPVTRLRRLALPHLVELHRLAGAAVALATWSRETVVYPERIYDRSQLAEIAPLLPSSPAHATAAGKVLLAFDPAAGLRYRSTTALEGYTPATITSPGALAVELDRARSAGFATAVGELFPDLAELAAPVTDRRRVVAAVGIAGPADRILRPDLGRMARASAAAITAALRTAESAGTAPSSAPAE
ncbi:MAG: IclR family transcriptional regulator [Catenulispora sp.]|nr:IclR family transcriptional regulator [Catenulispora sp.]